MFGRCVYDGALFHIHTDNVSSDGAGGTITASIQYQDDGDIVSITTGGSVDEGDWVTPKTLAPGSYTLRAHVDSGSLDGSSSAVDSDLALSSTRTWTVSQAAVGSSSATVTFTLKDGGGNTVASGQVTISATRNS